MHEVVALDPCKRAGHELEAGYEAVEGVEVFICTRCGAIFKEQV